MTDALAAADTPLERDDEEHPIPAALRPKLRAIIEAFVEGDFLLRSHPVDGVASIDPTIAEAMGENIADYGDVLAPLDDAVWERSCYRWMNGHWELLIDLTTSREAVSDLTLFVRMQDTPRRLEVQSVHVP